MMDKYKNTSSKKYIKNKPVHKKISKIKQTKVGYLIHPPKKKSFNIFYQLEKLFYDKKFKFSYYNK
jgi:hypothetical protein